MTNMVFRLIWSQCNKVAIARRSPYRAHFECIYYQGNLFHYRYCTTAATLNSTAISENVFARRIIENNPRYSDIIEKCLHKRTNTSDKSAKGSLCNQQFSDLRPDELCLLFSELTSSTCVPISNPSCENLILALKKNCSNFTDEQLVSVMKNLSYWTLGSYERVSFYKELCCEFDKVCYSRWKKWKPKQVLLFMDLWYGLNLVKFSEFYFKALTKLAHNPQKLSSSEVVLLLFHLNLLRTATKNAKLFELEYRLQQVASELSIDELGVAVMGFFKSNRCLFNEQLMEHLIDRLVYESKTVKDITFTCIMKALRKSLPTTLWPSLENLFDAVVKEVPRLSVQSCIHAGLVTTRPQFLHEPLICSVSQKIVNNISQCRLKDMEKAVFPLAQMAYDPKSEPCIFKTILKEIEKVERNEEIESYPKSFIALIHYFCLVGIYPDKYISKILDLDYIKHVYGNHKFTFGREVLCIDSTVELEHCSYSGNRLPEGIRNYLSKRYSEYLPDPSRKLTRHKAWHLEVIQTAETLFGKENVAVKYLLPSHPRPDIVVHLDESMSPLPLSESVKNAEDFCGPLRAPEINYYALIVGSKNVFLYNSKTPSGETKSKIKQLKLIGYNPVIVSSDNWPSRSTFDKTQHLKRIISLAGNSAPE